MGSTKYSVPGITMNNLHHVREIVDQKLTELKIRQNELDEYTAQMEHYDECQYEADQLVQLFQDASKTLYSSASNKIADIVTEGLNIVFPDSPYKFVIEFVERRNNIEADFFLVDNENEKYDPLKDVGGGVSDLIALLLRVTYIMLSTNDNILIADEPLKFIDRERIEDAAAFVRKLCEEFKFQMLVVSHIPEMIQASEAVYRVEKRARVSHLEKIN